MNGAPQAGAGGHRYRVEDLEAPGFAPMGAEGGFELDEGTLVPVSPNNFEHDRIRVRLFDALRPAEKAGHGVLALDVGFRLAPDTMRGPDLALIAVAQIPRIPRHGYIPEPPLWIAEILSPGNRPGDMARKVRQYLAAGVRAVWVVDPEAGEVRITHPGAPELVVRGDALLAETEIFPGLTFPARTLFAG